MRPFQYCVETCQIVDVLEEDAVEEDQRADEQHGGADQLAARVRPPRNAWPRGPVTQRIPAAIEERRGHGRELRAADRAPRRPRRARPRGSRAAAA